MKHYELVIYGGRRREVFTLPEIIDGARTILAERFGQRNLSTIEGAELRIIANAQADRWGKNNSFGDLVLEIAGLWMSRFGIVLEDVYRAQPGIVTQWVRIQRMRSHCPPLEEAYTKGSPIEL